MKKLLITGFEPFGGEAMNPSWEAAKALPCEIGGYVLTKLLLPVTFGGAAKAVLKRAEEICPDVILCIGQAGGRNAITPELVGINLRHASTPDNGGNQPQDEPILPGGETAYFSTLPVRRMAEAIRQAGVPAKVSYSAGTYVCNDLLYTLLAHYQNTKTKVGFIHVPYSTLQNKEPSMEPEQIVKGLTAAIEGMEVMTMVLQTKRLLLRPWREEDAEHLYRYASSSEVGPPAGWSPHVSVEHSREIMKELLMLPEVYAVCLKDGDPIGNIHLKFQTDMTDREDECELGYWLGKPFWGQGIIPEAAEELLRHAFEDLQVNAVWCGRYDNNEKSRRVQEKLGFVYHHTTEGLFVPQVNEIRTGHVMLMTKETWKRRRAEADRYVVYRG